MSEPEAAMPLSDGPVTAREMYGLLAQLEDKLRAVIRDELTEHRREHERAVGRGQWWAGLLVTALLGAAGLLAGMMR